MKLHLKAVLGLLACCAGLFAQSAATSQIAGTVQDSSGLAIQGARDLRSATATGVIRTAETGANGNYVLPNSPMVRCARNSPNRASIPTCRIGIVLQVATNPTIDATLQVGNAPSRWRSNPRPPGGNPHHRHRAGCGSTARYRSPPERPRATDLIFLAGGAATAA